MASDIALLHRQKDPAKPQFGSRLRCSGCHMGGGPILKELAAPHNDWFMTARPLPFGQLKPDATLNKILAGRVDAARLAEAVTAGVNKLYGSSKFQDFRSRLSLQEQLRCLFCPVELNLESDTPAFDENKTVVTIPSAFLVDPRLAQGRYFDTTAALRGSAEEGRVAVSENQPHGCRSCLARSGESGDGYSRD